MRRKANSLAGWGGWSPVMVHISVLMCTSVLAEYVYVCAPSCMHLLMCVFIYAITRSVCACVFMYEKKAGIGDDKSIC